MAVIWIALVFVAGVVSPVGAHIFGLPYEIGVWNIAETDLPSFMPVAAFRGGETAYLI